MAITSFSIFTSRPHTPQDVQESAMAAMLYQVLAEEHRLFIFARNCHWYVGDHNFASVQRYYEQFCMEMDIVIDAVRVKVNDTGYYSEGLLDEALEDVCNETVHYISSGKEQLQMLQRRHEALRDRLHQFLNSGSTYRNIVLREFLLGLAHQHELWAQLLRHHLA